VSNVSRALGAGEILAGDPSGTPAELEVAVYGLAGKKSSVAPLGARRQAYNFREKIF
jgi:hypothetical protein